MQPVCVHWDFLRGFPFPGFLRLLVGTNSMQMWTDLQQVATSAVDVLRWWSITRVRRVPRFHGAVFVNQYLWSALHCDTSSLKENWDRKKKETVDVSLTECFWQNKTFALVFSVLDVFFAFCMWACVVFWHKNKANHMWIGRSHPSWCVRLWSVFRTIFSYLG